MKIKRPGLYSDRTLIHASEKMLDNHLNDVSAYLAHKSKDPRMVLELMMTVVMICFRIDTEYKQKKHFS